MPPKYLPHKHLVCVIPCIISIIESRVLTRVTTSLSLLCFSFAFLNYETVVSRNGLSLGYSEGDTISVRIKPYYSGGGLPYMLPSSYLWVSFVLTIQVMHLKVSPLQDVETRKKVKHWKEQAYQKLHTMKKVFRHQVHPKL